PDYLNNCMSTITTLFSTLPSGYHTHRPGAVTPGDECYADNEASLAVRKELSQGAILTSLVGYTLSYNTLDNNKNPTSGSYLSLSQDFAGVGGDVNFIRTQ